jgi:Ca2+/Na+ antiporter
LALIASRLAVAVAPVTTIRDSSAIRSMVWLFLSAVLIVTVILAARFNTFRKAILTILGLIVAAAVVGGGWLYYQNREGEKREALAWRLIQPDQLAFSDMVLGESSGFWRVRGNVANRSSRALSGFKLKIMVRDCPAGSSCVTIGEDLVSAYVSVPPGQKRSFDQSVRLYDMPTPTKLEWGYSVQEVRAEVDQ